MRSEILFEAKDLKKYYPIRRGVFRKTVGYVKALDGVDFQIHTGETLGLVGESGCGKSTLGRVITKLVGNSSGYLSYDGSENLLELNEKQFRKYREKIQIIFQDPFSSLNPRMSVGDSIAEGLRSFKRLSSTEISAKVSELLESVGLDPDIGYRYPHEFSGGQRQRIGIARALAIEPQLIIADEPVSSLDVSVQAQIINLLIDLRKKYNLSYIFISHDLRVVNHISDRIAVMYLGKIVEISSSNQVFNSPQHPYTQSLISSMPQMDSEQSAHISPLKGEVPSPINTPQGCRFASRCPRVMPVCRKTEPILEEVTPGHSVACFLYKNSKT